MLNLQILKSELKNLLVEDTNKCIRILNKILVEESQHFDTVKLLEGQVTKLNSEQKRNLLTIEEYNTQKSKINNSLLEIVNELKEKNLALYGMIKEDITLPYWRNKGGVSSGLSQSIDEESQTSTRLLQNPINASRTSWFSRMIRILTVLGLFLIPYQLFQLEQSNRSIYAKENIENKKRMVIELMKMWNQNIDDDARTILRAMRLWIEEVDKAKESQDKDLLLKLIVNSVAGNKEFYRKSKLEESATKELFKNLDMEIDQANKPSLKNLEKIRASLTRILNTLEFICEARTENMGHQKMIDSLFKQSTIKYYKELEAFILKYRTERSGTAWMQLDTLIKYGDWNN